MINNDVPNYVRYESWDTISAVPMPPGWRVVLAFLDSSGEMFWEAFPADLLLTQRLIMLTHSWPSRKITREIVGQKELRANSEVTSRVIPAIFHPEDAHPIEWVAADEISQAANFVQILRPGTEPDPANYGLWKEQLTREALGPDPQLWPSETVEA